MLRVRSHAKVNLYLDVLGKRRDGYHNIETIFQTVSLSDELAFERRPDALSMECSNPELEAGPDNLVMRAAALLRETTGRREGVHVRLEKRIPVAAGLAGGSGNAAATLVGLNRLWNLNLSQVQLFQLAARLGSDVPYCLCGGTVAATGRGERLTPLAPIAENWFVLLHPPIAVSARSVYMSPALTLSRERPFAGRTASFRAAIGNVATGNVAAALFNCMEDIVFKQYLELAQWNQRLLGAGCEAAIMSGSGPTILGLCDSQATARAVAANLTGIRSTIVHSIARGLELPD